MYETFSRHAARYFRDQGGAIFRRFALLQDLDQDDRRRAEIAQRRRRQVQTSAEVAVEREPRLVDPARIDDPRVAQIDVVLPPVELLTGPGQVAGAGEVCPQVFVLAELGEAAPLVA